MNLRQLEQRVPLWEGEAAALCGALQRYLHEVAVRSSLRPMPLPEALSVRPITRLAERLLTLLAGQWTIPGRGGLPRHRPRARQRALRLEVDELLQVLALYRAGELRALLAEQQPLLQGALGRLHQQAQNLSPWFVV